MLEGSRVLLFSPSVFSAHMGMKSEIALFFSFSPVLHISPDVISTSFALRKCAEKDLAAESISSEFPLRRWAYIRLISLSMCCGDGAS